MARLSIGLYDTVENKDTAPDCFFFFSSDHASSSQDGTIGALRGEILYFKL